MRYFLKKQREISFPLGGIGTGSIGLAGNGSFIDLEIHNRPDKGTTGAFSHFAIKAEDDRKLLDARILQGDLARDYNGRTGRSGNSGFGSGPDRGTMEGLPHFAKEVFEGAYPFANLSFIDPHFPGAVRLTAFNPFIPTDEEDSSLPAAFFEVEVANTSAKTLVYSVAFSFSNLYAKKGCHHYEKEEGSSFIFLGNSLDPSSLDYGDLTIASDAEDVSYQDYFYRGHWFDNLSVYWHDFTSFGPLANRDYPESDLAPETADQAILSARIRLLPKAKKVLRFVLAWNCPNRHIDWPLSDPSLDEEARQKRQSVIWKNYYATRFQNSKETALFALKNFSRLQEQSRRFEKAFLSSSLPQVMKEAILDTASVLKSPTTMRLTDGSFYAFEGANEKESSCEGSCTHVWSYAYTLAYLFPRLERSARSLEYAYSVRPDGGMGFRLALPIGSPITAFRSCVDGQYGTAIRVYREYALSGDKAWLKSLWGNFKKSIAFAWSKTNPDLWDPAKSGLINGRQHNTLDAELFGPNAWLSGMYLSGLKAASLLAEELGDSPAEQEYKAIFEKGKKRLNEELYNGRYYIQKIDIKDKALLASFPSKIAYSIDPLAFYWDEEHQEIKYQIGEGCLLDQALGQFHADNIGLGEIFDRNQFKTAILTLYANNVIPSFRDFANPCRIYGMDDESGTIICSYPKGAYEPVTRVPYAEETFHGMEYAFAADLLRIGETAKALKVVKAIRDRYDGAKRNPWSENECGSNYARSLSSYSLLLAYSGFRAQMGEKKIGFAPIQNGRFFFALEGGWGLASFNAHHIRIHWLYGTLAIRKICLPLIPRQITLHHQKLPFALIEGTVVFDNDIQLKENDSLAFRD